MALGYTTAARASLALSTLPLQTMIVGALLRIEALTLRKSLGVGIAMLGVFAALSSGLTAAPAGAWRGEAIMTGAVLCMAFYNVWSRRFIVRSSALGFLSIGMGAGAAALTVVGVLTGRVFALAGFNAAQWTAAIYLGLGGGAAAFILWVMALQRTSPTLVANAMTVNPIAAGLLATQLVGEPITLNLVAGLLAGICRHLDRDERHSQRLRLSRQVSAGPVLLKVHVGVIDDVLVIVFKFTSPLIATEAQTCGSPA
jgi:drug/metabolite transporter (DMT)-like permease